MRLKLATLFLIVFIQGCSLKAPQNQWEYNSANAFSSYTQNFLSNKLLLAKSDLNKAIKEAKQSANLEQLGRVYLGYCALNISVAIEDKCIEYKSIENLINSKELEVYFLMLQKNIKQKQIENLPKQYQKFVTYKLTNNKSIFEVIKSIKPISSQFIAASLIKEKLNKSEIEYLIEKASFYGYKKLVLFWLNQLLKIEKKADKKQLILKKIKVLSGKIKLKK